MNKQPLPKEDSNSLSREELHKYIKSAVNKLGSEFSKEQKIEHGKLLVKIFEKGMTPKEAMNISDEELAQIYSFAYHKFSIGKFEEARELFKMMLNLEPLNNDFAIALGVCHHRLKDFEYAIPCYMLASTLQPKDPVPLFYAYDCFMKLNNEFAAGMMLCNVVKKAEEDSKYEHIKNDAQIRLDQLQKKILEDQVEKKEKSS